MKKEINIRIIFVLLFIFGFNSVIAQQNVDDEYDKVMKEIGRVYESGKMDKVISLYQAQCCKTVNDKFVETIKFKSVSKQIKARIYEYVALASIATDQPNGSELYLEKLFSIEYNKTFTDSWLIIASKRKEYTVIPRFSVGFIGAINMASANVINTHEIFLPLPERSSGGEKDYSPALGNHVGIVLNYMLSRNFSLEMNVLSTRTSFIYTKEHQWGETNHVSVENKHKTSFSYLEFPVFLRYQLTGKIHPYIQVGFLSGLLQNATRTMDYTIGEHIYGFNQDNSYTATIKVSDQIVNTHFAAIVGFGIDFKIKKNHFLLSGKYIYGLNDVVSHKNRYDNKKLMYHFYDVLDETKLKRFEFTFSYMYPLSYKAFKKVGYK